MSSSGQALRVVFFDAAGTLFHLPRGVAYHYALVARRFGVELDEAQLSPAFGRVWREIPAPVTTDVPRPDDDRGWWRELVERVLDDCAESKLDRDAYFAELYPHFLEPGVWELFPETLEVLQALHGRVSLRIISNFDRRLRSILATLGIAEFFDDVVISSECGADKPDVRVFALALERAGVAPEEALHVGDDPVADWEGAEAVGMHVCRLARPDNTLRELLSVTSIPPTTCNASPPAHQSP
ncbi:MAG TPA: HAD-IA family hydrolase [Chthoniobacteraceae bacterium]|jgi:putative hydrolase of the HAD superfamily